MSSNFFKKHLPVLLVGLSVILGLIGFPIYFKNQHVSYSFTDLIYSVIRLFLMDGDFTLINVNVILNIARFLAPLSLATAVIQWLLKEFSNRIKLAQVKRLKNHIIVCGDSASNKLLAQNIKESSNHNYILLHKDASEEESLPVNTVGYDQVDAGLIEKIAFYKSRYLIISFENDAESLSFANKLLDILDFNKIVRDIDIILLFKNPQWAEVSNDLGMMESINSKVRANKHLNIRYLDYIDKSIRKHMLEDTPDTVKPVTKTSDPALKSILLGSGIIRERLMINLALNAHYLNHEKLIVYVENNSKEAFTHFLKEYQINEMLDIRETEPGEMYSKAEVAAVYICENDELKIMQYIKALQRSEHQGGTMRFIFIEHANNITSLLPGEQNKIIDISNEVGVFGNIIDESLDEMAKTIHNDYLTKLREANKLQPDKATHQEWNLLPDEIKDRNRMQADHIGIKIRSLGCQLVPLDSPKKAYDWKNDSRQEALSEAEHNRWNAYMYYKGWKFGKDKNEQRKTHPDMIPYNQLDDAIKQYDRNAILNIPDLLRQAGFKIVAHSS